MANILERLYSRSQWGAEAIDWSAVYEEQLPRVYNFFLYGVGDVALAEDLTASTFEKAWRNRERYRQDLGAFSTWLFTVGRRLLIDHRRRQRPEVALDELLEYPDASTVDEAVLHEADLAHLARLLAALPARERELVALKYGADMSNRAIANLTGLSESNVGTILHRVVARLRAEWEKEL